MTDYVLVVLEIARVGHDHDVDVTALVHVELEDTLNLGQNRVDALSHLSHQVVDVVTEEREEDLELIARHGLDQVPLVLCEKEEAVALASLVGTDALDHVLVGFENLEAVAFRLQRLHYLLLLDPLQLAQLLEDLLAIRLDDGVRRNRFELLAPAMVSESEVSLVDDFDGVEFEDVWLFECGLDFSVVVCHGDLYALQDTADRHVILNRSQEDHVGVRLFQAILAAESPGDDSLELGPESRLRES